MVSVTVRRWRTWLLAATVLLSWTLAGAQSPPASNWLKGGGFEGESALIYWNQESLAGNALIRQVGNGVALNGDYAAVLGGSRGTVDTLSQFVGGLPVYYDGSTLSFGCKAANGQRGGAKGDALRVLFVDADTGNSVTLATVDGSSGGWGRFSFPISASALGLLPGRDYYLAFEATIGAGASPTSFFLDDVHLAPPQRAMLLPTDPPEPPDTIPDEDGDMPYESSAGIGFMDITPHRDVSNTCSCGFPAHQSATITTTGFSQSEFSSAVVKFKTPESSTSKLATVTSRSYDPGTRTGVISCIVPDSPNGKNYLGSASVKIKASDGKKAASPQYHFDSYGQEKGFWYGFPSPVSGVQLLSSGSPSVLGGEAFSVRATGMAAFTKWRPTANPPRCGDRPDQDFVHPAVFVKDGAQTKVKVLRSTLNPAAGTPCTSAPVNWTWNGTWSSDGAPVVCSPATPCIPTNTLLSAVFLNPDNVTSDGNLTPIVPQYKTQIDSFLLFSPPQIPSQAPQLIGAAPNWADSVGGISGGGVCGGPLSTNQVSLSGTNLVRVSSVQNADQTALWSALTAGTGTPPLPVVATAPAHSAGGVTVKVTTADGLQTVSPSSFLTYLCSYVAPCSIFAGPFTYTSAPPPNSYYESLLTTATTGQNETITFTASKNTGDETLVKAIPHELKLTRGLPDGTFVTDHALSFYVYINPDAPSGTQTKYDVVIQQACTGATIFAGQIIFQYHP